MTGASRDDSHAESRRPLHAELPVDGRRRSAARFQPADRRSSTTSAENGFPRSARDLEKKNFGPRVGLAYKLTDSFVIRSGYALTWIEQAGITTPFTTPLFPFIQTLGQQTLDNINPAFVLSQGPTVAPQPPTPTPASARACSAYATTAAGTRSSGTSQCRRRSRRMEFEAGYLGSKLTRLGVPDINLNQLTVEQLALGIAAAAASDQSLLRPDSANPRSAPDHRTRQLLRPYPRFHHGDALSQQHRPLALITRSDGAREALLSRLTSLRVHLFELIDDAARCSTRRC